MTPPASTALGVVLTLLALAAPPVGAAVAGASSAADRCAARLVEPDEAVAARTFATCVVSAMRVARTAHLHNAFDDGSWSKGSVRFTGATTDTSATYSSGLRLVVLKRDAWLRSDDQGWVKAKAGGTAQEQFADTIRRAWLGLAAMRVYRGVLASSPSGWVPTGRERTINKRQAREYLGAPDVLGVTPDRYAIWVDDLDRPIRIVNTTTVLGVTVTGSQDFSRWGEKVTITAPSLR